MGVVVNFPRHARASSAIPSKSSRSATGTSPRDGGPSVSQRQIVDWSTLKRRPKAAWLSPKRSRADLSSAAETMPALCTTHSECQCQVHSDIMHFALMETYADRLKWARKRRNPDWDATDAARAMGLKPPTYLAHENGSRGGEKHAERYATFYGVDLLWLLTGRGTPDGNRIQREYDQIDREAQKDFEQYLDFLKNRRKSA